MAHIIEITDLTAPDLQVYADLTHADPQKTGSVFLAESEKVIQYALKAGCRPLSFLMEHKDICQVPVLQQWENIPVFTGSRQTIRTLTGYTLDRGFLCAMQRPVCPSPSELLHRSDRIVILRNITDPTDLGAVFRSAAALGIDAVVIDKGCCDPLYRRSVRVSMGTVFQVPWLPYADFAGTLPEEFTAVTVTQHPDAGILDPADWKQCKKLAIILDGAMDPDAYSIPLMPDSEPLNMASASAVLFWMLRKQ